VLPLQSPGQFRHPGRQAELKEGDGGCAGDVARSRLGAEFGLLQTREVLGQAPGGTISPSQVSRWTHDVR